MEDSIYNDSDRIMQVLINLVNNAIKFSKSSGVIILKAEKNKKMPGLIKFIVKD